MPGGNGTGPQGLGPMTGRATGYCAGYPVPGYMSPIRGGFGRGWGRGRGFGRGHGWGRGFGWGRAFYPYAYGTPYYAGPYAGYPYGSEINPKEEADMLKEESRAMQEDIKAIQSRIKELESLAKSEKKEK